MKALNKKELIEKEVRALEKEERRLYEARSSLGYIELEKPIRHGWFKHLILRNDIANRHDAPVIQEILDKCGYDVWGSDLKHLESVWTRHLNKKRGIQFPGFKFLEESAHSKLSYQAKKWFVQFDWVWYYRQGYVRRYYCEIPRHFFDFTYSRAYITKRRIIDVEIEQRLAEIDAKLMSNKYYKHSYYVRYRERELPPDCHRKHRQRVRLALKDLTEDKLERIIYQPIRSW